MIINNSKKFIFIKTPKTAGSSIEFYLSQFCGKKDTITSLLNNEEKLKKKLNLPDSKNTIFEVIKLNINSLKKFKFKKKILINDHTSLNVLEKKINLNLKKYYIFAFVRNPFKWIISYFWWYLYHEKIINFYEINNLSKKEINILFKLFVKTHSSYWFNWIRDMITSKKYKVHIFKYENIERDINKLKKTLSLENERINFSEIHLKNLKIMKKTKSKLNLDKESLSIIKTAAKYFFDNFSYSKKVPKFF